MLICPFPIQDYPTITMAHGGGGRMMKQLIQDMILKAFNNEYLQQEHDGAVLDLPANKIAFTTDSYVIHPRFFPGGDIGSLAIHGTVNDLAMCGAQPLYLSVGFILEEGFPMLEFWHILLSMKEAADLCGIQLVTGDTKVVDKGKGDGIFINTSGVGAIKHQQTIAPAMIQAGDAIILSGDLARHGMAVMAVREGLQFESQIESDSAPIHTVVQALLDAQCTIHCLRDLTRGGLGSALNEIALSAGLAIAINENCIPVREDIQSACDILGLDPLYVANEGRFICITPQSEVDKIINILKSYPVSQNACQIGQVEQTGSVNVKLNSILGTQRIIPFLSGEQLPRIC